MIVQVFLVPQHRFRPPVQPPVTNVPAEFDLIEYYYKHKNLTHAWNEFGLRPEVMDKLR